MKKIEKIIELMKLMKNEDKIKEHEISSKIEDFIVDNFWDMDKENHEIAIFLNDEVIDICEQTELGLDNTNFKKEIKEAYNKMTKML